MGAGFSTISGPFRTSELTEMGARVYRHARALVDHEEDIDPVPSPDLRTLDGQLAIVNGLMREALAEPGEALSQQCVVELSQSVYQVHTVRFAIHDHLGHQRLRRLDALDRGLSELRKIVDQDRLLDLACETVAKACGFDRVMLSRIEGDRWRPWRSYARVVGEAEEGFLAWIRDVPEIYLDRMLLESEMVRNAEPALVVNAPHDGRVHAALVEASDLVSYVAAPILSGDRVIGLLHADYQDEEVTELDRDILWSFAIGFAQIFERAVLLSRLREQRIEVMRAMKTVETVLEELASAEIDLATRDQATALSVTRPVHPVVAERTSALESILTSRELEVLALMATGATNDRIARRLVIATDTVKSHVKHILRKLRVENRAEAISYYLRTTIGARED